MSPGKSIISCLARNVILEKPIQGARSFTASRALKVKTNELSKEQLANIKINQNRLWTELHKTCEWGKGARWGNGSTDTGMCRLSLSNSDKQARDWFVATTQALGCSTAVDNMGNIFAVRPGLRNGAPTCAGSHLDTQPSGGRYDGILGVHAGIEALRTMNDENIQTEFPVGVINWTNEEGARFPISMVSSGVYAGEIPLEKAHNLQEVGGGTATMRTELERIGYLGKIDASYKAMPIAAHFELHIEQGPILESSKMKIGIVEGSQCFRWYMVTVEGQDCHTGTTDFRNRSDAMLTAAKLILYSHNAATELGCLASTGILTLRPGSTNTVPGFVQFSLDIRSHDETKLLRLEQLLKTDFARIAAGDIVEDLNLRGTRGRGCTVSWKGDTSSPAIKFHQDCIRCVEDSVEDALGTTELAKRMISGAGHDSCYTSRHTPTSMIFVPCRNGISHNPVEYCSIEDCGNGTQVLLGAMLRYDRLRARREHEVNSKSTGGTV